MIRARPPEAGAGGEPNVTMVTMDCYRVGRLACSGLHEHTGACPGPPAAGTGTGRHTGAAAYPYLAIMEQKFGGTRGKKKTK